MLRQCVVWSRVRSAPVENNSRIRMQQEIGLAEISLRDAIRNRLVYSLERPLAEANLQDWYRATALAVRDRVVDRWLDVRNENRAAKKKRVYYLSIEFLLEIGRAHV